MIDSSISAPPEEMQPDLQLGAEVAQGEAVAFVQDRVS
jgi:hypothetical protein